MPKTPIAAGTAEESKRLPKTFEPSSFDERWYKLWESEGRFQPKGPPGSPRFVMVIPPPNVTGKLHIGHAYGRTVEDILARWKRMKGFRVLWVPGTDHAGIATQMVIERQLAKEGVDRRARGQGHDPVAAETPGLLPRLDAGAVHDGPGSLPGGPARLRTPLRGRAHLQGPLRRQLVSGLSHGRLGPRGRGQEDERNALQDPLRRPGRPGRRGRGDHPARD